MTDKELKDECMENAEIDLRRYSNNELTQIREAMRMYADRKLNLFTIPDVRQQSELLKEIFSITAGAWDDPVISEDLYNRIEAAISFNCG